MAHVAEADRVFEYLSLEYHRMGLDRCNVLHVLGDGADWIWRRARSLCSDGQTYIPTLDYFHAAEHHGNLAKILFGPETPEAREWSKALRDLLDEDQVDDFLAGLDEKRRLALDRGDTEQAEAVRAEWDYFNERRDLLNYKRCRNPGLPMGSGIVEGGIRFAGKDRLHRTGMRWHVHGAEAVLQLRATDASGERDSFTQRQAQKRLQRFETQEMAWQRAA